MKITLIGEIFYDEITPYRGKKQTGFGGTLYNLLTLANLSGPRMHIIPISYLYEKHFPAIWKICKPYANIDLSGLIPSEKGTETAKLTYTSWDKREEKILLHNPPIKYSHIKENLDADAILINMTALEDIALSTLQIMRESTHALIMMDIHSLPTQIDKSGIRYSFHRPNWKEWASCLDVLQGNQKETETLVGYPFPTLREIKRAHLEILQTGVNVVITTLGEKGAFASWMVGSQEYFQMLRAEKPEKVIDTTGSGDVFASSFLRNYLHTKDVLHAVEFANKAAGLSCRVQGISGLKVLKKLTRGAKEMRIPKK
jgi:sugar/nucleoside kinase (ribokinase family)